jgi:hypothetical protein
MEQHHQTAHKGTMMVREMQCHELGRLMHRKYSDGEGIFASDICDGHISYIIPSAVGSIHTVC